MGTPPDGEVSGGLLGQHDSLGVCTQAGRDSELAHDEPNLGHLVPGDHVIIK